MISYLEEESLLKNFLINWLPDNQILPKAYLKLFHEIQALLQLESISLTASKSGIEVLNCLDDMGLNENKNNMIVYILKLDQLLKNCFEVDGSKSFSSLLSAFCKTPKNTLALELSQLKELLDVMVFSALYDCKSWPKFHKQHKANSKDPTFPFIVPFYNEFQKKNHSSVKYLFNPENISKKHKRDIDRKIEMKNNIEPFLKAVKAADYDKVTQMLEANPNILQSKEPESLKSAMHLACSNGDLKMCKVLDFWNCDWEATDRELNTPIYDAIEKGSIEVLDFLFEKGVNREHKECQDRTPIYYACFLGNMEVVSYLHKKGCDVNCKSSLGRSPLLKSSFVGNFEVVKFLLSLKEIEIDLCDTKMRTALHNAAWGYRGGPEGKKICGKECHDSPECVRLLVEHGAKINSRDFEGNTPLCSAASSEGLRSLEALLELGAEKDAKNNEGETPLLMAAKFGHFECLKALILKYSANLFAENNKKEGILEITIDYMKRRRSRNLKVFEFLINSTSFVEDYGDGMQLVRRIQPKINSVKRIPFWNVLFQKIQKSKIHLAFDFVFLKKLVQFSPEKVIAKDLLSVWRNQLSEEQVKELGHTVIFEKVNDEELLNGLSGMGALEVDTARFFKHLRQNNMRETFLLRCLKQLKIAFITYRDEESCQNYFHLFVKHRMTEVIVELLGVAALEKKTEGDIVPPEWKNPEVELLTNKEEMKKIFTAKDKSNMSFKDMALLMKFLDINSILENFASFCLGLEGAGSFSLTIPKYELVARKLPPEQHEAYYTHSKRLLLEKMNEDLSSLSKSGKKVEQYTINNKADLDALREFESVGSLEGQKGLVELVSEKLNESLLFVDTEEGLEKCVRHLEKHQVLGVDLEFFGEPPDASLGFICTMQISTVEANFVLDSFRLREGIKKKLKPVFESAEYLKLFHSPETDFKFLKADLDFNVVNHFDTNIAAMLLQNKSSSLSLATLALQVFHIPVDKSFQVSDWRIRPLPNAMLQYAMNDAKLLIYLFFHYKKQLEEHKLEGEVASRCNTFAIKKIEKNFLKPSELRTFV